MFLHKDRMQLLLFRRLAPMHTYMFLFHLKRQQLRFHYMQHYTLRSPAIVLQ
jgi:hypothetical protein